MAETSNEPEPASAPSPAPSAPHRLSPNARWNGYKVSARVQGGPGEAFSAVSVTDMEPFVIRVQAISDSTVSRRGAWETLKNLPLEQFVACVDAVEDDGWRYEVFRIPTGTTLREWITCHKAGLTLIEKLVTQLSAALGKLHSQGVVHLNLSPDEIFVQETGDFVVGGLESAIQHDLTGVWVAAVPPFYAPPEAIRNTRHEPGVGLFAWDWWAVGRIVQEFVLGKHVICFLFDTDVVSGGNDLRLKAEALMCEREPPNIRAGAVETMPEMAAAVQRLLRGLLTSARDARWGAGAVKRWLERQPVKEKYDLPTDSQLFVWEGQGLTPAETADLFSSAELWAEGERQLLDPPFPGSFSSFMGGTPSFKADWNALRPIIEGIDSQEWSEIPSAARKTAVAALVWRKLSAGKSQRPLLLIRGRRVEPESLISMLRDEGRSLAYYELQAMLTQHFRNVVAPDDAVLGRTLDGWAATWEKAFQHSQATGWIPPGDLEAAIQLLELVFEPEKSLGTRVAALKAEYPASRLPEVSRLLTGAETGHWINALLMLTGLQPERFGYVKRSAWVEERRGALQAEYAQAVSGILAVRLKRLTFLDGGILSGRWEMFLAACIVLAAYSVFYAHELMIGFIAIVGLLGLRVLALWMLRKQVGPLLPPGTTMTWRDGWAGAGRLSRALVPPGTVPKREVLTAKIAATRKALAELGALQAVARPPGLFKIGAVVAFAVAWLGLSAMAINLAHTSPEVISAQRRKLLDVLAKRAVLISTAGKPDAAAPAKVAFPGVPDEEAKKLASGNYEVENDGFGPKLKGPLKHWTFFAKDPIIPLPVASRSVATGDERAEAMVNAELLLNEYGKHSVNALIAVPVPVKSGGTGYLVYSGKDHTFADADAYMLSREPTEPTWYEFGGKRMVYIGRPAVMGTESSTAKPIPEVSIDPDHLFTRRPADEAPIPGQLASK